MQECNLNQVFTNYSKEEEIFSLTTEIDEAQKANDKLKHCFKRNMVLDKGLEVSLVDNINVVCKDGRMIIPKPLFSWEIRSKSRRILQLFWFWTFFTARILIGILFFWSLNLFSPIQNTFTLFWNTFPPSTLMISCTRPAIFFSRQNYIYLFSKYIE